MFRRIEHLIHGVTRTYLLRWFYISSIIGVITGTLVWILGKTTHLILEHTILPLLEVHVRSLKISTFNFDVFLKLFAALLVGHFLSYLIVTKVCEEARGSGCDLAFYNYSGRRYLFRLRVPFMKVIATIPTLGLGASVGKEGPAVLIGASTSSLAERMFKLDLRDLKVAYIAGISAGISAALSSPLGGTVFGIEFLRVYEIELEILEVLYPCLVASVVSYLTSKLLSLGSLVPEIHVTINYSALTLLMPNVVLAFVVLGIVVGFFARIYAEVYYLFKILFFRYRYSLVIPPLVASLTVAIIGTISPLSITTGYDWLNDILHVLTSVNNMTYVCGFVLATMFVAIVLKILATSITIASGSSGGMIAPTIVTGGYIGVLTYLALARFLVVPHALLPALTIAGAATLLGCVYRVPISAILILSGVTETWPLTPLVALSMAIAYLIAGHWTLHPKFKH